MRITNREGPHHVVFSSPLLRSLSVGQMPPSTFCSQTLAHVTILLTFSQLYEIFGISAAYK